VTTYYFKHRIEKSVKFYIPQGALIVAAIASGFKVSINVVPYIGISKRTLDRILLAERYDLSKEKIHEKIHV
ncbi:MAG: hypothetical protein ACRDEA_20690, partial [Microcystaceae cyanobacterium]